MKTELEIIVINWELFEFKSSVEFNRDIDKGLYQIYGNHNSYGQNSLLYIGKARDNTFSQRLLNDNRFNGDFRETTITPTAIRLGWISKHKDKENIHITEEEKWSEYIDIAEHLLISTHPPALNSQLEYRLFDIGQKYADKNIIILNMGDRGNILPEISTFRNSYLFYDHDMPFQPNPKSNF